MRSFILTLIFLSALPAFSQQQQPALLDSLLHALPAAKEDTNKVKLLLDIVKAYTSTSPKQGYSYAHEGMKLAEQLQWKRGVANLYNSLGLLTHDTGNAVAAIIYFEKSFAINQALAAKPFMITNMSNIGRSYQQESNFIKASEYYFKALAIAEESGNDEQAALLGTNITSLFMTQGDYSKASKYAELTIKKGEAANTPIHIAKARELLGVINLETKDTAAAKSNFEKALAIDEKLGNKMAMASVLSNLGTADPDPAKQIATFVKVQKLLDEIAPASPNSIVNLANLGLNYYNLGLTKKGAEQKNNFDSSGNYLNRALALCVSSNNPGFTSDIKQAIASLEEAKGNYKGALRYYREYTAINDSVFSQENKNKIAALESQRAIDLKNKEIENKELQIGNQQKRLWLLVSFVAFLAIVGFLLYRQGIARKKNNRALQLLNTELADANKVKSKFFGILSHDLRSPLANLLNFLQLQKRKPGLMSAEAVAAREDKIAASATSLLDTMETMLLWSKGQMEHFKPVLSTVAAADLFAYLQKFFADVEHIAFVFMDEENTTLQTDEHYLKTILHNLTANAVKALQQTPGASITWKAWKAGTNTYFSITDNGPGAGNEQLKALYDETASAGTQHGLGLHIIRDLAKAIECNVSLQPKKDRGTEFILSI